MWGHTRISREQKGAPTSSLELRDNRPSRKVDIYDVLRPTNDVYTMFLGTTRLRVVAFIRIGTRLLQHLVGGVTATCISLHPRVHAYLSLHFRAYAACVRLIAHLQTRTACISLVFVEVTGSSTGASDSLAAWEKLQRLRDESGGGRHVLVSQPMKGSRVYGAFCVSREFRRGYSPWGRLLQFNYFLEK